MEAAGCTKVTRKSQQDGLHVSNNAQQIALLYHPGRNYYKIIPWNNYFVLIFVIITKLIPPEHVLCNVAAIGLSLFAGKQAKEFAL